MTEQPIELKEDLSYEEQPVEILESKEKVLRNKTIRLVRVLWWNHRVEESTWEREDEIRERYPQLLVSFWISVFV
ncbi:hypothetical protein, partial [Mycobacterium tuberculosis]